MKDRLFLAGWMGATLIAGPALATGGHHAVDDAAILAAGQCHVESWGEFWRGSDYFATLSPACHFGGLEWTLGLEREHVGEEWSWNLAPQVKAAWPLGQSRWSMAAALAAGSPDVNRYWDAATVVMPLSFAGDHFDLHFNLGYDWVRHAPDYWRYGASVYRRTAGPVAGIAAAFREADIWHGQLSLRWYLGHEGLSADFGYTRSEAGSRDDRVAIGVNYEFSR